MERWKEIQAFRAATGVDLFFGLNGLYHRANKSSPMSTDNLESFMQYAKAQGSVITGFELG